MFSLFNFSSIFQVESTDPICLHVRTPMDADIRLSQTECSLSFENLVLFTLYCMIVDNDR